jgi:hypothetical protein
MAHAHKTDFVFRRNGRVYLNRRGIQFIRLLAAEVCASAVVMLYTPCAEVVWRVLATHYIRQFPLQFASRTSLCAITFQLDSNAGYTTFRGSVKSAGYPIHSPVSPSLPLPASQCAITFQLDSNARYTMFWGSVKSTGYPIHSPVSPSLPSRASPCTITFQLDSILLTCSCGLSWLQGGYLGHLEAPKLLSYLTLWQSGIRFVKDML